MLAKIAAFEFRYQATSPLFLVAAALLFVGAFCDMAVGKFLVIGGGNVLFNAPHAIIVSHLGVSFLFLFLGAAFVANAVVRDDQTGFGPLLRATDMGKANYLFGRFLGAFAVGALIILCATLGQWIGTLMPFADQAMIGPNRFVAYLYGYGLFALPNALIIASVLFALATVTRSTAGTFLGVVGVLVLYFLSQGLMAGAPGLQDVRVLADPLGMSAYMAGSRYFTASELNAGAVPVSNMMVLSRVLWVGVALALLGLTYRRFRFEERGISRRKQRKLRAQAATVAPAASLARLAEPRFDNRTALAQFTARAMMEARSIFRSPVFLVLLIMATVFALPGLLTPATMFETPQYPLTTILIPILESVFATMLVIIATYYGGELVWREREHKVHEILDATPIPAWASMLPKVLGLALVLFATIVIGAVVALAAQLLLGGADVSPVDSLRWYLLPAAVDALVLAALAVFVQALSPSKFAGWGVMVLYLLLVHFGPALGLEHALLVYGTVPDVPLSDMVGSGLHATAAWWFRLFWGLVAVLLLIATHLLWPRGTDTRLLPRLRRLPLRLSRATGALTVATTLLLVLTGGWIVYNTLVLNDFRTSAGAERHFAEYERRFFHYARLPQPVVQHVELDVALYPEQVRAEVRGRYRLVNATKAPIHRVHVRLVNRDLRFVALDLPASTLEHDADFNYRIYRLDVPMQPGETRTLAFRTLREQRGFRATATETGIAANGSDLDSLELTPRIGMTDAGLLTDPALRRKHGLPGQGPFPRLDDLAATQVVPNADLSWTTADITVSTSADQLPIAPGKQVAERVEGGRRIVRFVSDTPIKNFFSIQSAKYAIAKQSHDGVDYAVYHHPAHRWNVDRMLVAMRTSIAYYHDAFGPYQFDQARIVETPSYRSGAQAFANTIPASDQIFAIDLRDPGAIDMVTIVTAHEFAHQWWGHQVLAARMQGAGFLVESLAQYSALMVMKRLHGEAMIRPLLQFQHDRYLSGRRTQVLAEEPLASVHPDQQHIAYGKGALAMYLLQDRMGEDAVNRALKRFVERYRFTTAPYPRSTDLIALLRDEATTDEQQVLITDLFERITLYDLKVEKPTAVLRADGLWDVTVPVEATKFHADGSGKQTEATLDDTIEIGLFTAEPGSGDFGPERVVRMERPPVRSGKQVFRFVTREKPTHAGVDPYNLYIDRNPRDNVGAVEAPEAQ